MKRTKPGLLSLALLLALACAAPARAQEEPAGTDGFGIPSGGGGRFRLLDTQDRGSLIEKTEVSSETASPGIDDISSDLPFSYTGDSWNSAREAVESGRISSERLEVARAVAISTGAPLAPEPQVEFRESGTTLSVTGRKVITLNYSGKRYIKDQTTTTRARSTNLFEITQQMQVRMQGKVGQKITVNVDYDDTKVDKQDISVVYQGDPNEAVQNIAFGDIDLSLPATEFVSYNKQLFGIRADIKTGGLKFTFVGSRTKGTTKTKQFTGNTQFQKVDINDTSYLRRRYYDLTFGNKDRLPLKVNSETVYIDRQSAAPVDNITIFERTADKLAVLTSTYTGRFQLLSRGSDYVMDYANGMLTFASSLNTNDVVIIDFKNTNGVNLADNPSTGTITAGGGSTGNYKIIKTSETGSDNELKTYYSIGQTNIVRDNGTGNFSLVVQDLSHNFVGTSLNPVQKYPDGITVDFEQGIFYLKEPFGAEGAPGTPDAQVYAASPASKRLFHVEYSYRFKTFILEGSIVLNSEVVRVDNVKYTRNTDYFIDYDSGFITFYYPEKIGQDSKIDISYEVSAYGGTGNQSLVGGRISYDLGSHFSLGSTLLYQGGVKGNTVPNVTDLVNSMLVYEGDAQLRGLNLLGLRTTIGGEIAQSKTTPNLNDYALIDNMEGVKQEDSTPLDKNYWVIASNPVELPADPNAVSWANEAIKAKDINSKSSSDGTQQVLAVNYDFSISSEVSIAYPLSNTGIDFSGKKTFEMVIYGVNASTPGPTINIHYGQIDEDADGRGGQIFSCSSGLTLYGYPRSEDTNCDGQVATGEDIGWEYWPAGKTARRYGASNGRLDSEDLNNNGRLDSQDFTGGDFGYRNSPTYGFDGAMPNSVINFSGWRTITAEMPITSANSYKWNAIKQVRISLTQTPGGATSGVVKFARVAAVGNSWAVVESTGGSLNVSAPNNIDNTDYDPIYDAGGRAAEVFTDLYGDVTAIKERNNVSVVSEQALALQYSALTSSGAAAGYAYRTYSSAIDISQHETLRFLVYSSNTAESGVSFFLRAGSDNSYFKVAIPLTSLGTNGWHLIEINQEDITRDSIPDVWTNASPYSITVSSVGLPSLQQISQFRVGVEATDASPHTGTIYFNELHLKGPIARIGNARKVEGSVEVPGWFTVGGKHRYVDRGFQTPVTAITNQDNETASGYLNLTRLSFFPINVTAAKQITVTPNAAATGANNLVTTLQEGKVKKFDGTASGTLGAGAFPRIGMNYTKGVTSYNVLARKDDRDTYAASFSYNVPGTLFLLPRTVNANYSLGRSLVNYDSVRLSTEIAVLSNYYNTKERTDIYGGKLTFVPWKGSSINPNYSLQTVRETRARLSAPDVYERYPKSMQQTVDVNSNFMLARWLNPSANYSVTTMENNNLNTTTVTVSRSSQVYTAGQIKSVTRSAQGGVSLAVNVNDLMPSNRLLRSMSLSSNYQIQDGDSWSNIAKDYNTRNKLWLRDPIAPTGDLALRNSLTMRDTINSNQRWQPFEAYNIKGAASALKTLSITNNYTNSVQRSEVTGTISKSINRTFPDMIVSLSQLELLTHTRRWAQNSTLNLKYSRNTTESVDVSMERSDAYGADLRFRIFDWMDTAASYNLKYGSKLDLVTDKVVNDTRHNDATLQGAFQWRKFRFTPKVDYVMDKTVATLGVVTQQTRIITPSLLIKSDFTMPKGFKIPFTKTVLALTNRIVWTTTLSYAIKSSPITIADNNRLFSLNTSADYEMAKNLRLTLNGGFQRFWSKNLKEEEFSSYQIGSTLTFQF